MLDNVSCHVKAANEIQLSNIRIHFLPPNLTSSIQPLDQGIINSFKSHYRSFFLEFMEIHLEDEKRNKCTIKDAISMIAKAWNRVKDSSIINCWRKANIVNMQIDIDMLEEENDLKLIELSHKIIRFSSEDPMNAEDYIEIENIIDRNTDDVAEITERILIESNLISKDYSDKCSSEETELQEFSLPTISISVGLQMIKDSLMFLEQQDIANDEEFEALRSILQKTEEKAYNSIVWQQKSIKYYFK